VSDTPETDAEHAQFPMGGFTLDFARKLERERDEALSDLEFRRDLFKLQEQQLNDVRAERDRLAEELKEAQNAIEMMLRDSSCRRIPACTEEQLAAVKGGSDE
jgi:hypothetical protein